jgi:myosin heavy subunit
MTTQRDNTLTYVLAGVIALLLVTSVFAFVSNSKNKKNLGAEKLKNERLLSEKLQIEKDSEKLKTELSALASRDEANRKLLEEVNQKIADLEKRINTLNGENRSLRNVRKELEELQKVKADLEQESQRLRAEQQKLMVRSEELQKSIDNLQSENKEISEKLIQTMNYNSDNFLVTAVRGKKKERVVIFASRAKRLNVTFEVPRSLTEEISFSISTPSGQTINPDNKSLSWIFPDNGRNLTASLSPITGEFEESRQVVLTYTAKEKLSAGDYSIQILCNNMNIGNCRIRLK